MSKNLSFEQTIAEMLKDIPLPSEDMAWEDMKRRLDAKRDKKWFLWNFSMLGCGLFLFVSTLLVSGVVILYSNIKSGKNKHSISVNDSVGNNIPATNATANINIQDTKIETKIKPATDNRQYYKHLTSEYPDTISIMKAPDFVSIISIKKEISAKKRKLKLTTADKSKINIYSSETDTDEQPSSANDYAYTVDITNVDSSSNNKTAAVAEKTIELINNDSLKNIENPDLLTKANNNPDSAVEKKTEKKVPQKISFATGIAMWQRIASFGSKGEPATGVSPSDVTTKALDYLPSVYARLYKGDKWFLQTEYRFRASQKINNITINKKIEPTPNPNTSLNTSVILTRIQYHQLPLTFNYFVTKNWSVGGGISWNRFNSATAIRRVSTFNSVSQRDSLRASSSFIINKSNLNDSLLPGTRFSENYFQGIVETQLKWRKFSLGLQYTFGIQPYIRYTLPGSQQRGDKSNLLNIFIRYEIWRNKPK